MARVWRATADEAEAVASLLIAFRDHLGHPWPSENAFLAGVERLIEDRDTEYLLAAPDGETAAAGVAQLRFRWGIWRAGGDCLVEDVFVLERARGHGLGRALMDAAAHRALERGCRRMELDVSETNDAGLALYLGVGFVDRAAPDAPRDIYLRRHLDAGPDA